MKKADNKREKSRILMKNITMEIKRKSMKENRLKITDSRERMVKIEKIMNRKEKRNKSMNEERNKKKGK